MNENYTLNLKKTLPKIVTTLFILLGFLSESFAFTEKPKKTPPAETFFSGDIVEIEVTGFNEDVIANGVGAMANSTTNLVDSDSFCYLSEDWKLDASDPDITVGLPEDGIITSPDISGLTYQMSPFDDPYEGDNCLRIDNDGSSFSGDLTFDTPGSYSTLYLLSVSGSGSSDVDITVNFDDGTSEDFNNNTVSDWFNTGLPAEITGIGRGDTSNDNVEAPLGNPKLFRLEINISAANQTKTIESLSFTKTNTTDDSVLNIFAVSGEETEDCIAPYDLAVSTDTTTGEATITWESDSGNTAWDIEYGVTGFSLGSGTQINGVSASPYTLSGLTTNTVYEVYIKGDCSGVESSWSDGVTFELLGEGAACENPIDITTLPYNTTDNTEDYLNNYSGAPGTDCASTENYLNGNDVVYHYSPDEDDVIDILLSDISGGYAGIFIYENCSDIGDACIAGAVAGANNDDFGIEEFQVYEDEDYYIVISSWLVPDIEYTLDIIGFDCNDFATPIGEANQEFVEGDELSSLSVSIEMTGSELTWYSDAAGTNEIPDTTEMDDGETYYVAQTFNDCDGEFLEITVTQLDCDGLEITDTTDDEVICRGMMTLEAEASEIGHDIYWYNAETEGNVVGVGNTFETPDLTSTTSYWASEVFIEGNGTIGGIGHEPNLGSSGWSYDNHGLSFTADEGFFLYSVDMYSTGTGGEININLIDSSGNILDSTTTTLPPGSFGDPEEVTINLNFSIPTAGNYSLVIPSSGFPMTYEYLYPNVGYPFPIGDVGEITSATSYGNYSTSYYYFFYNWNIVDENTLCESDREEVVATVTSEGDVSIEDSDLPYLTTDNTSLYGNNFSGSPGSSCGTSTDNLAGNDVIYMYSPQNDNIVNIEVEDLSDNNTAGVFVYESCGEIGEECIAGSTGLDSATFGVEDFYVTGGQDYFIVISTANGNNLGYELTINGFDCNEVPTVIAEENQYFVEGYTLSDIQIEEYIHTENITWYEDEAGTTTVPETTELEDGETYYVNQTILGCESELIAITVSEFNCDDLSIANTTNGVVCQSGNVLLQAEASETGNEVYWYDAQTDGNLVGVGEEFETPNITANTSYWAAEVFISGEESSTGNAMQTWSYGFGSTPPVGNISGLALHALQPFTIVDVEVFIATGTGGTAEIQLQDSNGNEIESTEVSLPGGGSNTSPVPQTLTLNFEVPAPGDYRLVVYDGGPFMMYEYAYPNVGYPMAIDDVGEVTSGISYGSNSNTGYYFFYNWTISKGLAQCESEREEAIAEVNTTPTDAPIGEENQELCAGAVLADIILEGDDFMWYDAEEEGTQLDPTTELEDGITYYATQVSNACESEDSFAVTISITPTSAIPNADANQSFEEGETIADLVVEGENLVWYADEEATEPLAESTPLENQTTYYVSQTEGNICPSELFGITTHVELNTSHPDFETLAYYPNPMNQQLTISNTTQIETVIIYNIQGQKVITQKIGYTRATIDVAALASGTYFLEVSINGNNGIFKLIKE